MKKKKPFDSETIATGDINMNIDFFNKDMGGDNISDGCCETALCEETKRYIKRYYIKPQNIVCSNKSEIIDKLAEIGDENCVIYSLVNLDDHDDIQKLGSQDIIYYYEDNVLYDKNHVQIFEYDLSPKHEEQRKKFDVDNASTKEFVKHYSDRITDETDPNALDNDIKTEALEEELFLSFPEPGEPRLARIMCESATDICCICGEEIEGYGNNAQPYAKGKCCDACNIKFVIPARIQQLEDKKEE